MDFDNVERNASIEGKCDFSRNPGDSRVRCEAQKLVDLTGLEGKICAWPRFLNKTSQTHSTFIWLHFNATRFVPKHRSAKPENLKNSSGFNGSSFHSFLYGCSMSKYVQNNHRVLLVEFDSIIFVFYLRLLSSTWRLFSVRYLNVRGDRFLRIL